MYRLLLTFALLACASLASATDSYLCIGEKATGFNFENGEWEYANFNPNRYIIRKATEEDELWPSTAGYIWNVTQFGENVPSAGCKNPPDTNYGWLDCNGVGSTFTMYNESLRFQTTIQGDYLGSTLDFSGDKIMQKPDEGGDPSVIEIGTCSPL